MLKNNRRNRNLLFIREKNAYTKRFGKKAYKEVESDAGGRRKLQEALNLIHFKSPVFFKVNKMSSEDIEEFKKEWTEMMSKQNNVPWIPSSLYEGTVERMTFSGYLDLNKFIDEDGVEKPLDEVANNVIKKF